MKIKSDFVTNSSSTCFVVFVPARYTVSDDILKAAIEDQITWWDDEEFSDGSVCESTEEYMKAMKKEVIECIETLKNGDDVYKDNYGDGVDYRVYSVVDFIMTNEGFGLTSVETSGDGMDQIAGCPEDKIMNILGNYLDITEFCKVTTKE